MSNPASTLFGPFWDSQSDFGSDNGNGNDSSPPVLVTTAMASPEATALAVAAASSSQPTVPTLSPDISTLISWITRIKMSMGGAPMLSAADAPKLKGQCNFLTFLEDFKMLADNTGWTDQQKCQHVHKYCNSKMRPLIRMLKSCKRNDWDVTVAKMCRMYLGDECQDKHLHDSLEHFVARDRMITKKAHFIDYHQKFCTIAHNLHDHVSEADQDHLFWKGLPKNLRCDIFQELRSDDKRDWHKAPTIAQVYDEVTKRILDKDSVFANLMASQGKSKSKTKKHDLSKKKKHAKFDDLFSDNSDNESSDSEDEAPRRKSKKHSSKCKKRSSRDDSSDSGSSTDDESSSSDDSDSDSETSDDDLKYMGSSKKKHSSSCSRAKDSKDKKPTKTG